MAPGVREACELLEERSLLQIWTCLNLYIPQYNLISVFYFWKGFGDISINFKNVNKRSYQLSLRIVKIINKYLLVRHCTLPPLHGNLFEEEPCLTPWQAMLMLMEMVIGPGEVRNRVTWVGNLPADHSSQDCRVHYQLGRLGRCLDRSGAGSRHLHQCCTCTVCDLKRREGFKKTVTESVC